MAIRSWFSAGVPAGLLAGAAVALFFLLADLLSLSPLATPTALGETFLAPGGGQWDLPVVAQLVAIVSYGANLLAFTVLHFLVFAALGVGAVAWSDLSKRPLDVKSGALYGLVVCTAIFYLSLALPIGAVSEGVPHLWGVLVANLIAGAVIGVCAGTAARVDRGA